jgi:hypothetical protein
VEYNVREFGIIAPSNIMLLYCIPYPQKINGSSSAFIKEKTGWKRERRRMEIISAILLAGRCPAKKTP